MNEHSRGLGVIYALTAAVLWGMIPLYIDLVDTTDPVEIVVHRALWSGVLLTIIIARTDGILNVIRSLTDSATRWGMAFSTLMLSVNWLLFVYAVQSGQVVEAAFGYFIYPLVAVVLGMVVLGETLDRWSWVSVGMVAIGVCIKGIVVGALPWLALSLAITFALYSVSRKKMAIGPLQGMFVETFILIPPAIGYLAWMHLNGQPLFFGGGAFQTSLAVMAGVITVTPLVLFHAGNRALTTIMSSLVFYANPTTQLLLGLNFFGAPVTTLEVLAFVMIWAGVVVYFSTRRRGTTKNSHPQVAVEK